MNKLSVAISRDEDAQHDLVLGFGTKGTIISGLSEADLLEIRSAIDCAISKGEDDAHARLIAAAPELLEALELAEKKLVRLHISLSLNEKAGMRSADKDPDAEYLSQATNKAKGDHQ